MTILGYVLLFGATAALTWIVAGLMM